MSVERESVIEKIEKLLVEETLNKKSPLSFSLEELKIEIEEAEKEGTSYSHDEVKLMLWEN